jgi:NADPH2 dehydrogenase
MAALFQPLELRSLTLGNRVVVSPMCQYSAEDGCATDWHLMHLGQLAVGGHGLLIMEMTNVEARGRITPGCMGLYDDACEAALARVVRFIERYGNTPLAIQLAHAGRKASSAPPWEGRRRLGPEEGGWEPVAPSAVDGGDGDLPRALEGDEIESLVEAFAASAERARRLGFAAVELHAAHGYLLHQFLSPLANTRTDRYGGSLENRMRFPLAVFDAVRAVWPDDRPLGVRVSATDWAPGGWDVEGTLAFAAELERRGCDWIDVSGGGLVKHQAIQVEPGYQVPYARRVKAATTMAVMAVGLITEPRQAEQIVASGHADLVALARGMLWDPHWTWHAADALGVGEQARYPNQYLRCQPTGRQDVFVDGPRRRAAG